MRPLRILTWHVHGNYLYYLALRSPHTFLLPVQQDGSGYGGRGTTFHFGENVVDVPAHDVRETRFDLVLYQSRDHYLRDRWQLLSERQRQLPAIYLEHDPPRDHPTDTHHPAADDDAMIVHVTPFNALMWDSGAAATRVIEHGVVVPPAASYTGDLARGLTVVNNLPSRGRRLGADVFARARCHVPLDLVGMGTAACGGLGEVGPHDLAAFESPYRFFFNPIRYTSLGLAVCEAMMLGMPVVGLATTEMATVIENGVSGYVSTDETGLIDAMRHLLADPEHARRLGEGARRTALDRFNIDRFTAGWNEAFAAAVGEMSAAPPFEPAYYREVAS